MTNELTSHNQTATLSISTGATDGAPLRIPCTVGGIDGRRLTLESRERVSLSTPISLEYNDALFLGEVIACRATGLKWEMSVHVEQVLTGLQSLMILRSRLLGENVAQTRAVAVGVSE